MISNCQIQNICCHRKDDSVNISVLPFILVEEIVVPYMNMIGILVYLFSSFRMRSKKLKREEKSVSKMFID